LDSSEATEPLRGSLDERGLVNPAELVASLGETLSEMRLDNVRQALQDLAAYALFTASLHLPRDAERELSRRVNERLARLGG
jgi:hypothetical protein